MEHHCTRIIQRRRKSKNRPANSGSGSAGFSSLGLKKFIVVDIFISSLPYCRWSSIVDGGLWTRQQQEDGNRGGRGKDRRFPLQLDSTRDTERHTRSAKRTKDKKKTNIDPNSDAANTTACQQLPLPPTLIVVLPAYNSTLFDSWHTSCLDYYLKPAKLRKQQQCSSFGSLSEQFQSPYRHYAAPARSVC